MSHVFAILEGIGGPELLFIAILALLMFGSKRLPELGRAFGRAMREFKRATSGVEENLREALREEPAPSLRAPAYRPTARTTSATTVSATEPGAPVLSEPPPPPPPQPGGSTIEDEFRSGEEKPVG